MKIFILKITGFSLIELMAVVAIIGILVSLALPRFRTFVAKSRMSEAVQNLGIIDRLQKSYNLHYHMFGEDDTWFNDPLMGDGTCTPASLKNKLGFRVEDCTRLRYFYKAGGSSSDNANSSGAAGRRIYPGCGGTVDEWTVYRGTQASKIEQTKDIIESCK